MSLGSTLPCPVGGCRRAELPAPAPCKRQEQGALRSSGVCDNKIGEASSSSSSAGDGARQPDGEQRQHGAGAARGGGAAARVGDNHRRQRRRRRRRSLPLPRRRASSRGVPGSREARAGAGGAPPRGPAAAAGRRRRRPSQGAQDEEPGVGGAVARAEVRVRERAGEGGEHPPCRDRRPQETLQAAEGGRGGAGAGQEQQEEAPRPAAEDVVRVLLANRSSPELLLVIELATTEQVIGDGSRTTS